MNNTQLLILVTVLVLIYLYWKHQLTPKLNTAEAEETIYETELPELETKPIPAEKQDWFTEKKWLSDLEIDWALEQILSELPAEQKSKYKVLESTQFMFAKESMKTKDTEARDSFPVLLSELTSFPSELVFLPVNNPDFHWSLLVYEAKSKKFYHFDTLKGANDSYAKPLVKELLSQLLQTNEPNLKDYWETRYHLKQGNSWDCGVAVIEITKAIIKDYPTYHRILMYTKLDFDFPTARKEWRNKLENHA